MSNLPAIPSSNEWDSMKEQATVIAKSGLAPDHLRNNPNAILAIALKGRELGVPPMQALSHIHVIKGKPTLSAEMMRALVFRAGHKIYDDEANNNQKCTLYGVRGDDPTGSRYTVTFTIDDAKQAGLLSNPSWRNYPRAMLLARATSELCRLAFPDVIMGASYTPEELGADVTVDDQGGVVAQVESIPDFSAQVETRPALDADITDAEIVHEVERPQTQEDRPQVRNADDPPTDKQIKFFNIKRKEVGIDGDLYYAGLKSAYGVDSIKDLTRGQLSAFIEALNDPGKVRSFLEKASDYLGQVDVPPSQEPPEEQPF